LGERKMALKNKRKWIFLSILIVALSIGITFALINPVSGSGLGSGTLYVYIDEGRTTEAPTNPAEIYLVLYERLYYFNITGITEYSEWETIHIWAHYQDSNHLIGDYEVGSGGTIDFEWTIPDLPIQTEIKYKYGLNLTGPNPSWFFAKRTTEGVGLTLVIPQVPLGVLGATSAFIAAYGLKALTSKRRFLSK
jgi:hypothetical protein